MQLSYMIIYYLSRYLEINTKGCKKINSNFIIINYFLYFNLFFLYSLFFPKTNC